MVGTAIFIQALDGGSPFLIWVMVRNCSTMKKILNLVFSSVCLIFCIKLYLDFIIGTYGPVHHFNNRKANFYISTGNGGCSVNGNPKTDADYFCSSFYGSSYKATKYTRGTYQQSGRMGFQMHKRVNCMSDGEDIYGTSCSGHKCKVLVSSRNHKGLYNIVCSNIPGISL